VRPGFLASSPAFDHIWHTRAAYERWPLGGRVRQRRTRSRLAGGTAKEILRSQAVLARAGPCLARAWPSHPRPSPRDLAPPPPPPQRPVTRSTNRWAGVGVTGSGGRPRAWSERRVLARHDAWAHRHTATAGGRKQRTPAQSPQGPALAPFIMPANLWHRQLPRQGTDWQGCATGTLTGQHVTPLPTTLRVCGPPTPCTPTPAAPD
jgi:hypothetical protein